MSDDKVGGASKDGSLFSEVGAGALVGGAIAGPPGAAVGALAPIGRLTLQAAWDKVSKVISRRRDERFEDWWRRVVDDDEAFLAELDERLDAEQAEAIGVIKRAIKDLDESSNSDVIKPMACLARQYLRGNKAPDLFFRGTSRLFGEINSDELTVLVEVLRTLWVRESSEHGVPTQGFRAIYQAIPSALSAANYSIRGTDAADERPWLGYFQSLPSGPPMRLASGRNAVGIFTAKVQFWVRDVFILLKRHDLAHDAPHLFGVQVDGMMMDVNQAGRLLDLVD